jgi:hypothetical protein
MWSTVLLLSGCTSMSHTEQGAVTGGVVGGAAGALVGSAFHAPLAGAAVGAGVGALAGGAAGNAQDRAEDRAVRQAAATQAAAARSMLTLEEIVKMTQSHIEDAVIINQIRQTGSVYNLNGDQIIWLKQQGVSDAIITEMQTRYQAVYTRPAPVVIYERPAPVYVGVGGYYGRRW